MPASRAHHISCLSVPGSISISEWALDSEFGGDLTFVDHPDAASFKNEKKVRYYRFVKRFTIKVKIVLHSHERINQEKHSAFKNTGDLDVNNYYQSHLSNCCSP